MCILLPNNSISRNLITRKYSIITIQTLVFQDVHFSIVIYMLFINTATNNSSVYYVFDGGKHKQIWYNDKKTTMEYYAVIKMNGVYM